MELTPEERQRIYEEEKARLEAKERLKAEAKARESLSIPESKRSPQSGKRVGCLVVMGVLFVMWLIGAFLTPKTEKREEAKSPPKPDSARVADCERRINGLSTAGVLQRFDSSRATLKVYVGRPFYTLTYDQKEGLAKLLSDCMAEMAGSPGGGMRFEIRDGYSGEKLYTWEYYKLTK